MTIVRAKARESKEMTMDEQKELRVWCNSYEAVAARSEEEAREIVRAMGTYDEEDIDGDGWAVLPNDKPVLSEDGPTGETVGSILAQQGGKPGPVWSCEV